MKKFLKILQIHKVFFKLFLELVVLNGIMEVGAQIMFKHLTINQDQEDIWQINNKWFV